MISYGDFIASKAASTTATPVPHGDLGRPDPNRDYASERGGTES